jgi:hypothetical protein
MVLASFIFPVALMFFVTGALYTFGIKGTYSTEVYSIPQTTPLPSDMDALKDVVIQELQKKQLPIPTGYSSIKNSNGLMEFDWRGVAVTINFQQQANQNNANLTVKKANWYQMLIQLHKANGTFAFKIYAAILAISLIILLITGLIMALQLPKYRNLTYISLTTGVLAFVLMVMGSLG